MAKINVKIPDGRTITLDISPRDTLASALKRIADQYDFESADLNVIQENMVLDLRCAISDLNQGILFELVKKPEPPQYIEEEYFEEVQKPSFYEQYKTIIWVGIAIITALILFCIFFACLSSNSDGEQIPLADGETDEIENSQFLRNRQQNANRLRKEQRTSHQRKNLGINPSNFIKQTAKTRFRLNEDQYDQANCALIFAVTMFHIWVTQKRITSKQSSANVYYNCAACVAFLSLVVISMCQPISYQKGFLTETTFEVCNYCVALSIIVWVILGNSFGETARNIKSILKSQ